MCYKVQNHRNHPCTFDKSWGLNVLQSTYRRDRPCSFRKLETKSKILVNPSVHCTLFLIIKLEE
ncbi:hypothetical protein Hanom_Chr12g01113641 [Helianthus anomalus]